MTIKAIHGGGAYYSMEEDNGECPGQDYDGWHWYPGYIVGVVEEADQNRDVSIELSFDDLMNFD